MRLYGTPKTVLRNPPGFFSIKGGYNLYIKSNAGDCHNKICPGTNNGDCTNTEQCTGTNLGTNCTNSGTC